MNQQAASETPWSEEDLVWLETVQPEPLRLAAKRHGRVLFAIVWQAGVITEALGRLVHHAQRMSKWGMRKDVQGLQQATQVLAQMTDQMCKTALMGHRLKLEQFIECKQDIERTMALAQGPRLEGDRVSKGGIILDS